MKFLISLLFICSTVFHPALSQAFHPYSDGSDNPEDVSLPAEFEIDEYDVQEMVGAFEAAIRDFDNAEPIEGGYRIRLSPAAEMITFALQDEANKIITAGSEVLVGLAAVTAAGAGTAPDAAPASGTDAKQPPGAPDGAKPATPPDATASGPSKAPHPEFDAARGAPETARTPAATRPPPPALDPPDPPRVTPRTPAATRPPAPAPPPRYAWRDYIRNVNATGSNSARRRFMALAEQEERIRSGTTSIPQNERFNIRRLGRSRVMISGPNGNRLLRFGRIRGNYVEVFKCPSTKNVVSWFRILRSLGSSCTPVKAHGNRRIWNLREQQIANELVDELGKVHPSFKPTRIPKGFFFGGGPIKRMIKYLVWGAGGLGVVYHIGMGIYYAYDDGELTFVEVGKETLEAFKLTFQVIVEHLSDNETLNQAFEEGL